MALSRRAGAPSGHQQIRCPNMGESNRKRIRGDTRRNAGCFHTDVSKQCLSQHTLGGHAAAGPLGEGGRPGVQNPLCAPF